MLALCVSELKNMCIIKSFHSLHQEAKIMVEFPHDLELPLDLLPRLAHQDRYRVQIRSVLVDE